MENKKDPHYYSHARVNLIRFTPPGIKNILEVGCGGGMTGKALEQRGFEKIVGIEIHERWLEDSLLREEMGREGRMKVLEKYTVQSCAPRLFSILNRVLEKNG